MPRRPEPRYHERRRPQPGRAPRPRQHCTASSDRRRKLQSRRHMPRLQIAMFVIAGVAMGVVPSSGFDPSTTTSTDEPSDQNAPLAGDDSGGGIAMQQLQQAAGAGVSGGRCLVIAWGIERRSARLHPITHFPDGHAATGAVVCGQVYPPGAAIPAGALWSTTGATDPLDSSCQPVTSGGIFYAMGFPARRTSNTGLDVPADSTMLAIVRDAANQSSLVMVHDAVTEFDGGHATVEVIASESAGTGMTVLQFDDTSAANRYTVHTVHAVLVLHADCLACTRAAASEHWREISMGRAGVGSKPMRRLLTIFAISPYAHVTLYPSPFLSLPRSLPAWGSSWLCT